jgi:hypothetical protein
MKLTMKWGGKVRNRKTFKPEQKIRWDLLGMTDPAKEKSTMPIDEVRRQVLVMSSSGFGQFNTLSLGATPKKGSRVRPPAKRPHKPRDASQ